MYRLKCKAESVAMLKGRVWEMLGRPRKCLQLMSEQRLVGNLRECSSGSSKCKALWWECAWHIRESEEVSKARTQ